MPADPTRQGFRMRITVVLHDFSLGGAERIALRLAGCWAGQGAKVTLVSGAEDGPLRLLLSPDVELVAPPVAIDRGLTRHGLARFLASKLEQCNPEIVFLPGNYYFGLARPIKDVCPRVRVTGKISNGMERAGELWLKARLRTGLLRRKSRHLDRILLAHESFSEETMHVLGVPAGRLAVVGQPVLDAMPPGGQRRADAGALVAAGRLVPQKNFALMLEALARLPSGFTLTIYGDGPLRAELEARARSLGVANRTRFAGLVPDLADAFAGAGLFVLSSDYEGFGTVVIEALAHGVPVVATACSASVRSFLAEPVFGRAVPPRDAAALAGAIAAQTEAPPIDTSLLRAAAQPYVLPDVAQRYLDVFAQVLR